MCGSSRNFRAEVLEAQAYPLPKTYFNRLYTDPFRVISRTFHRLSTGRGGRSPDFRFCLPTIFSIGFDPRQSVSKPDLIDYTQIDSD